MIKKNRRNYNTTELIRANHGLYKKLCSSLRNTPIMSGKLGLMHELGTNKIGFTNSRDEYTMFLCTYFGEAGNTMVNISVTDKHVDSALRGRDVDCSINDAMDNPLFSRAVEACSR